MPHGHSAIDSLIALTALRKYQEGGPIEENTILDILSRGKYQTSEQIPPLSTTGKVTPENLSSLWSALNPPLPEGVQAPGLGMLEWAVTPPIGKAAIVSKAGKAVKGARKLSKVPKNPQKRMEFYGEKIGHAQRGNPEMAMVNVQMEMGGGVLSYAIEPMGDIINRAYTWGGRYPGSMGVAREKVNKVLNVLKQRYGFAREHSENLISNAKFHNIPVKEHERKVNKALQAYKKAHSELPAYNEDQKLIKEANLAFADQKWNKVTKNLEIIKKYMDEGVESWNKRLGK